MAEPLIPIPRYGERSLADLMPSIMSALGVGGFSNPLGLDPVSRAVLLVVDGLGDEQLRSHAGVAPFLDAGRAEPLTAGFPATTVASLGSIGTGLPPGEHGLVGYTFGLPGYDRAINVLTWSLYGLGPQVDLRQAEIPERIQSQPTVFERAAGEGLEMTMLGKAIFAGSGFTRAAFRGARLVVAETLDALVTEVERALQPARSLV